MSGPHSQSGVTPKASASFLILLALGWLSPERYLEIVELLTLTNWLNSVALIPIVAIATDSLLEKPIHIPPNTIMIYSILILYSIK
jgi:hypothetical protein